MAIIRDGKVYRNMQEQVLQNQIDIAELQRTNYTFKVVESQPEDPDEKTIYLVWDEDTSCYLQFIWNAEDEQFYAIGMLPSVIPTYNIENGSGTNSLQQIGCSATGENSIALGNNTQAKANGAHAEGKDTIANNSNSHAEGDGCKAKNGAAHAEGSNTTAVGPASHAEGIESYVYQSADGGHAEGQLTKVHGVVAHAGGYNVVSDGYASFGHGQNNSVFANTGTVFGNENSLGISGNAAAGASSTILGSACTVKQSSSSLVGGLDCHLDDTGSPSYQSILFGWGLKGSGSNNKAIFGRWNLNTSNALLEIGNGTADNNRKCAFQVLENGTIRIPNYTSSALTTQIGYKTVACVNGVLTVIGN